MITLYDFDRIVSGNLKFEHLTQNCIVAASKTQQLVASKHVAIGHHFHWLYFVERHWISAAEAKWSMADVIVMLKKKF
jgi:hypothetical protein